MSVMDVAVPSLAESAACRSTIFLPSASVTAGMRPLDIARLIVDGETPIACASQLGTLRSFSATRFCTVLRLEAL